MRSLRKIIVAGLTAGALVAVAGPASAQDDPYTTPTPSTAPEIPTPSCGVATNPVSQGAVAVVEVRNVPAGDTVRVFLRGEQVAQGTAPGVTAQAEAIPVRFGGAALAAQADVADMTVSFTVPEDLPAGRYTITVVGAAFTTVCGELVVEVLGTDGGGVGGGSMPRTGIYAALLVAVALLLLLVGRALVEASRRRRRAARAGAGSAGVHEPAGV